MRHQQQQTLLASPGAGEDPPDNNESPAAQPPSSQNSDLAKLKAHWQGMKVEKWFGGKRGRLYQGEITEIWIEGALGPQVHIEYEDGDSEDLELEEALEIIKEKTKIPYLGCRR
jgi:hypothetical protein